MTFFEKIMCFLDSQMIRPPLYGVFHLCFVFLIVIATIIICCKFKNCSRKTFNKIILISWIIILVLEIYKQLVFSFSCKNGVINWDYQWYAFPLQLCSSPLYILPIIALCKDGKLKDCAMSFIITFALFGGLAVMLYPGDVFVETIGVNLQTMIHHGLQVILGIFIMVYNRKKLNGKFLIKGFIIGIIYFAVAVIANIIMPLIINERFVMMYLSPYENSDIPIISNLYSMLPYPIFVLLFLFCYIAVATIVFYIGYFIIKYFNNKNKEINSN